MHPHLSPEITSLLQSLTVLVVEDNSFTRRINRGMLAHLGVKTIHEAVDGADGLEAIRRYAPDLVIVDWDLPLVSGAELVRMVRSPKTFPLPDIPIIVLTCHGERWRVIEAQRCGANEFLVKPASARALLDRIVSIFMKPRPIVQLPNYYGPQPRAAFMQYLRHAGKHQDAPAVPQRSAESPSLASAPAPAAAPA
jgi:CheY-like chemotaxis protein